MTTARRRPAVAAAALLGGALLGVGSLVVLPSAPVAAEDVSPVDAVERARAAADGDPGAVEELRAVTSIDGQPVDLGPVFAGDADERADRIADLAELWAPLAGGSGGSGAGDAPAGDPADQAAADRAQAVEVLDQDRYKEADLPRPFRRPLQWLGDRIIGVWDRVVAFLSPVLGTRGAALLLAAALLAGLVAVLAAAIRRRSTGAAVTGGAAGSWLVDPTLDPGDLEASADRAGAAGDHDTAVRLRYEAGLLRLVAAGRLELRPDTTAAGAARQVGDPTLDELTATFEEIVYGDRPATRADDDASIAGWRAVLGTRSRR